ncbi:hypothetical protein V5O48_009468 [Marasmius crinis-equi]|uniref:F-box domain-containing protein n=1 Tax=Marasmius crinis-equi TaxID=585013 RepID=A0ABR3FBS0_9AGAR
MEPEEPGCFHPFHSPYLRLYEKEETYLHSLQSDRLWQEPQIQHQLYNRPAEVTLEGDNSQSEWYDFDAYRYYHVKRFLGSLKGFFTGKLDMSGRHPQRFSELSTTYLQLKTDIDNLRETAKLEEYEIRYENARTKTSSLYVVTDEELWKECRLKWKLPRLVEFDWLVHGIDTLAERLEKAIEKANGEPIFQKLTLIKMPVELLDLIFRLADLQRARLLASTCKLMKDIGMPYLHHERSMILRFASHEQLKEIKEILGELEKDVLDRLAMEKSRNLITLAEHLVSRPEITNAIRNLYISDRWKSDCWELPSFRPYTHDQIYYGPINSSLSTFLASCHGLTHLSVSNFSLTNEWFVAISQLSNLHTLRLVYTCVDNVSVQNDILSCLVPTSPHILNLHIRECDAREGDPPTRESNGEGLWFILLLFPNLVTLNHYLIHDPGAIRVPSLAIQDRSDLFCRGLQRLNIKIILEDVPSLTAWILSSHLRTLTPCTLTHFKLRTDRPMPDVVVFELLQVMSTGLTALEVLVLEGIEGGSLNIIETIAQLFPDLLGLTLILGTNQKQNASKDRVWPRASWEYARRFRIFRRLVYFGWNFHVPEDDVTGLGILGLEAGTGLTLEEGADEVGDAVASIARPFACYCPTLEALCLEKAKPYACFIERGARGEVETKNIWQVPFNRGISSQEWNPCDFRPEWKPVMPIAA